MSETGRPDRPRVRIVERNPPNIREIRAAFDLTGNEIFAWGPDTIFNPSGAHLSPALIAHETEHVRQQNGDPEAWWDRYLRDAEFRLDQEVVAHRAEWEAFKRQKANPRKRRRYLGELARRLASAMYGSMVSPSEARALIRRGGVGPAPANEGES
ncbi:MAG: hypothetical protein ACLFWG_00220 [Longimicrobiales bacterium]